MSDIENGWYYLNDKTLDNGGLSIGDGIHNVLNKRNLDIILGLDIAGKRVCDVCLNPTRTIYCFYPADIYCVSVKVERTDVKASQKLPNKSVTVQK